MLPISVILPVYNGIKFVEDSVISVLQQNFRNFELLIVDDCSTDGSWEYLKTLNDSRVTIFKNPKNCGLFYNLNFLIGKSRGNLIKLWSQDDIMYSHCLASILSFHMQ